MFNPLKYIEQFFYTLRGWLWNYPDHLWVKEGSLFDVLSSAYKITRPYSHFIASLVMVLVFGVYVFSSNQLKILARPTERFVEGVIVGVNAQGELQSLSKVNPLYPTLIQLERDINALVYEPLLLINQDSSVIPVLAERVTVIQEGADYEIELRQGVKWHDSTASEPREFSLEDVLRTLDIISQIDTPEGLEISYVQAVKQMAWEKVGENAIRICTTTEELQLSLPADSQNKKCSGVRGDKPILANFLELISFKIMPAHLTVGLSGRNIYLPEPQINKRPVGTGPFMFSSVEDDSIILERNEDYFGNVPKIKYLEFRLFRDRIGAFDALQNGEIHALSSTSTSVVQEMINYPQVKTILSPVLANQYWAVYFNLRKDLDDNPVGPEFFGNVKVRRAISAAINRDRAIQALNGIGSEAIGPIYKESEYFNAEAEWERYDPERAVQLLEEEGWIIDPNIGLRTKDNVILSFKLSYVDTPDRSRVVDSIRQDLEEVGIELIPDPWNLEDLFTQVVSPKLFDSLLYGMNTFIDPDRYELFHSEQSLNLSSYSGSDITVSIKDGKTVKVPRVDRDLERARSFDPVGAKDQRKEDYLEFQRLVAEDVPVIFLYHPQFVYYVNKRVINVDLEGALSVEQRFVGVEDWEIVN